MRVIRFLLVVLSICAVRTAAAQRAQPIGVSPQISAHATKTFAAAKKGVADLPGNSGTPRWVRWGLVGAIGGAVLFTLADGFSNGAHSTGSNILAGAATGFVVVGGGVLLYDSICSGGSGHSGFCGR
ncbi:MAG: hypothetical protein M3Z17_11030 [Gemmatimonadota bacterium]|nr:hypothetical protein [Gemmatimonadota bacterium]